jgi:hypothetical protein
MRPQSALQNGGDPAKRKVPAGKYIAQTFRKQLLTAFTARKLSFVASPANGSEIGR